MSGPKTILGDYFNLNDKIYFVPSLADIEKRKLLIRADGKVYSPRNWHRGLPLSLDLVQESEGATNVVDAMYYGYMADKTTKFEAGADQVRTGKVFVIRLNLTDIMGMTYDAFCSYLVSIFTDPSIWKQVTCQWVIVGFEAPYTVMIKGKLIPKERVQK